MTVFVHSYRTKYAALCNYFDLVMYIIFLTVNTIYLHRIGEFLPLIELTDDAGCPVFNMTKLNEAEIDDKLVRSIHYLC